MKVTKKDIQEAKKPDAVLEGATSVFDWIIERRNLVIGVLAALVVVIIGASIARSRADSRFREMGGELAGAVALIDRPVVEKPEGKADEKSFPSTDAKKKAVSDAFTKIATDNKDSVAGTSADLVLAQQALTDGKYDDAISRFETYINRAGNDGLALFAYEGLGYAQEGKGDLAKAEQAFEKLNEVGAPGRAKYHHARLLEKQGKTEEAKKAYEEVVSGFEKDVVAQEARTRLDLLALPAGTGGNLEAAPAPAPEEPKPGKKAGKKPAPK